MVKARDRDLAPEAWLVTRCFPLCIVTRLCGIIGSFLHLTPCEISKFYRTKWEPCRWGTTSFSSFPSFCHRGDFLSLSSPSIASPFPRQRSEGPCFCLAHRSNSCVIIIARTARKSKSKSKKAVFPLVMFFYPIIGVHFEFLGVRDPLFH